MTLTNEEIITANMLLKNFLEQNKEKEFPAKVIFYIYKNQHILEQLTADIQEARLYILQKYGRLNEDQTKFLFEEENRVKVESLLQELSLIKQEVKIETLSLQDLEGLLLTQAEMETLFFMITE